MPVTAPELLSAHRALATDDLEEARHRVAAEFCAHRLEPVGRDRDHAVRFNTVVGEAVSVSWLDYGGAVRLRPEPFRSFVLVQIPLASCSTVRSGRREVRSGPGVATVPDPDLPSDMTREAGNAHLLVRLDRATVSRHWDRLTGPDRTVAPQLAPSLDLRTPAGRAWADAVELLRTVLEEPDAGSRRAVLRGQAERMVIEQFLLAQRHHGPLLFAPAGANPAPRAIREAEHYLVGHARQDVTVEDAAAAVGLSPRALQAGFRRHLGTTPTERLREARLLGAHRELRSADPTAVTVSDVASAWGFGHLGRFASTYRRRFGQAPSQTLRG